MVLLGFFVWPGRPVFGCCRKRSTQTKGYPSDCWDRTRATKIAAPHASAQGYFGKETSTTRWTTPSTRPFGAAKCHAALLSLRQARRTGRARSDCVPPRQAPRSLRENATSSTVTPFLSSAFQYGLQGLMHPNSIIPMVTAPSGRWSQSRKDRSSRPELHGRYRLPSIRS